MVNSGLYNASEEEYVQQVHIRKPGEKDNAPGAILQRDGWEHWHHCDIGL